MISPTSPICSLLNEWTPAGRSSQSDSKTVRYLKAVVDDKQCGKWNDKIRGLVKQVIEALPNALERHAAISRELFKRGEETLAQAFLNQSAPQQDIYEEGEALGGGDDDLEDTAKGDQPENVDHFDSKQRFENPESLVIGNRIVQPELCLKDSDSLFYTNLIKASHEGEESEEIVQASAADLDWMLQVLHREEADGEESLSLDQHYQNVLSLIKENPSLLEPWKKEWIRFFVSLIARSSRDKTACEKIWRLFTPTMKQEPAFFSFVLRMRETKELEPLLNELLKANPLPVTKIEKVCLELTRRDEDTFYRMVWERGEELELICGSRKWQEILFEGADNHWPSLIDCNTTMLFDKLGDHLIQFDVARVDLLEAKALEVFIECLKRRIASAPKRGLHIFNCCLKKMIKPASSRNWAIITNELVFCIASSDSYSKKQKANVIARTVDALHLSEAEIIKLYSESKDQQDLLQRLQSKIRKLIIVIQPIEKFKKELGKSTDNSSLNRALSLIKETISSEPEFFGAYCDFIEFLKGHFSQLTTEKWSKIFVDLLFELKAIVITQGRESCLRLVAVLPEKLRNNQFADLILATEDATLIYSLLERLAAESKPAIHKDLIQTLSCTLTMLSEDSFFKLLDESKASIIKVCGADHWKALLDLGVSLYWPSTVDLRTKKLFEALKSYESLSNFNPLNLPKMNEIGVNSFLKLLNQAISRLPTIRETVLKRCYAEMQKPEASPVWIKVAFGIAKQAMECLDKSAQELLVSGFISAFRTKECQGNLIERFSVIQLLLEKAKTKKIIMPPLELTETEVLSACAELSTLSLKDTSMRDSTLVMLNLIEKSSLQKMSQSVLMTLHQAILANAEFAAYEAFTPVIQRISKRILLTTQFNKLNVAEKKLAIETFLSEALKSKREDHCLALHVSELVHLLSQMQPSQDELKGYFDRLDKKFAEKDLESATILCLLELCGKIPDAETNESLERTSRSIFSRKMQVKFCSNFCIEQEKHDSIRDLLQKDLVKYCDRFFACMLNQVQDTINDHETIKNMINFYHRRESDPGHTLLFLEKFIPYAAACVGKNKPNASDLHRNSIAWLEAFLIAIDRMSNLHPPIISQLQAVIPLFGHLVGGVDVTNKAKFTGLVLQFLVRIPSITFWTDEIKEKFKDFWTNYSSKFQPYGADEWAITLLSQLKVELCTTFDLFQTAFMRMFELAKQAQDTKSKLTILKIIETNYKPLLSHPLILKACFKQLIELMGCCPTAQVVNPSTNSEESYFEILFMTLNENYMEQHCDIYVELMSDLIKQILKSVEQIDDLPNELGLFVPSLTKAQILRSAWRILDGGKEKLGKTYYELISQAYDCLKKNSLDPKYMEESNGKNCYILNVKYIVGVIRAVERSKTELSDELKVLKVKLNPYLHIFDKLKRDSGKKKSNRSVLAIKKK